jgi:lipid II:glycine glycyltransferase (peptidoglycan interpeptide bridge formation enzyme)
MKVSEVKDKKTWEEFAQNFSPNNFLASWAWGEFNEQMGDEIFRLGVWSRNELVGACLAIKVSAKRGSFLLCPSGPMLKKFDSKLFESFISELKQVATEKNLSFIRVRPLEEVGKLEELIKKQGFRRSPTHVHAQVSWGLDITESEENLLVNMRKTTRYLVKNAIREGLVIKEENTLNGVRILENLQEETVLRHKFRPFSNKYLEKEFETFRKDNQVKILLVYKNKEVLGAAMIIFYGDSAFYHHGASVRTKTPASYLLQWEAIKEAKKMGKKFYNFWGIAPTDSPKHPWAGLTYFKQGFGGFRIEYTKPHDFPISRFYPLIYWFEKIRNRGRGLG